MAGEYGTTRDEETPLIANNSNETFRQKFMRVTHQHRFRIIGTWAIVIAITAVLTVSLHYALKDNKPEPPHIPEDPKALLEDMCVSDRSWFVALLLSIFFGPLGKNTLHCHA